MDHCGASVPFLEGVEAMIVVELQSASTCSINVDLSARIVRNFHTPQFHNFGQSANRELAIKWPSTIDAQALPSHHVGIHLH